MPQFARPTALEANTGWYNQASQQLPTIWQSVDEPVGADDGQYIQSSHATNDVGHPVITFYVSAPVAPPMDTGHKIRFRARWGTPSGGAATNYTVVVALIEEFGTPGNTTTTIRAQSSPITLTTTMTTYEFALSEAQAAAITNYARLMVGMQGFAATFPGGSYANIYVESIEFEVPDIGFTHLDIDGAGFVEVPAASGFYLTPDGPGFLRVTGNEGGAPAGTVLVRDPSGPGFKVQ